MGKLQELQNQAEQAAQTAADMNEASAGGGGGRLLPEGYALGRLVEVVEFGKQPQEFQGVSKDPAEETQLGFALWGEAPNGDTYHNEDGTPYVLRPFPFALSRNEKARAYRLFKALNWKGTAKCFAQLLGEAFLIKIHHVPKSKKDKTLVSRIDFEGFLPPLDPVTKKPYPVPEPREEDLRLFLWDYPTKEGWDSLFIEGQRDDGTSKNFIQERIIGALNYEGSPLQQLLEGQSLPNPGEQPKKKEKKEEAPEQDTTEEAPEAPQAPKMPDLPPMPGVPK